MLQSPSLLQMIYDSTFMSDLWLMHTQNYKCRHLSVKLYRQVKKLALTLFSAHKQSNRLVLRLPTTLMTGRLTFW